MKLSLIPKLFAALRGPITAFAIITASFTALTSPAQAEVSVHFHSYNGSVLFGRYPHTFIVFDGTLEETGVTVDENFGFSAKNISLNILSKPVKHVVITEKAKSVRKTNRHFSLKLTDAQYLKLKTEVESWRNHPGKYYDLANRNCIHFVGRMAELLGLKVDYPAKLLRKPKAWLNHVSVLNPKLGAKAI